MSPALLPLKILLILIDITITIVTFGWVKPLLAFLSGTPLRSVAVNGEESHRVAKGFENGLATTPREGVATLYDLASDSFRRYADRKCIGSRQFLGMKSKKVKEFGPDLTWITYREMGQQSHKFGAALRKVGCVPASRNTTLAKVTTPSRIAIFENTCAPWMLAAIGAFTQGITVTTVYATLGMDAVVEAINENVIPVLVCNKKDLVKLGEKCKNMKSLHTIVYTSDLVGPNDDVVVPKNPSGVTIISFEDFVASGDTQAFPPSPPSADSTAVVMYTSGSTGSPKGVLIKHRQIVAACASAEYSLGIRDGEEVYLAYLPLAHIMEMMAEFVMLGKGCSLCYADPKSLTATGSYPKGALEVFSPTIMVAVPKIWDVIKKGIQAKVANESAVKQYLVQTAFEWRDFCVKNGFDSPPFKALVFKKFSKAVGGRLRLGLSGGGPLNSEVQDFIRVAFGIAIVQGYGLTETCAGCTIQAGDDVRSGVAGVPIASCEVKLESTPTVGDKAGQPYLVSDRFDVNGEPVFGRGEVLIKGGNVSSGYYMLPEKTKEEFKDDGWFATGDIGQFSNDGSLQIVDRKKNLVKLKGGEYIAMERMEMTYGNSTFVDAVNGGICCYGDGEMDRPVAILQLSEPVTMKWAKDNGISGDFVSIKKSKELYDAVLENMKEEHKKSDLSGLEKLVAVSLISEPWTPENGCLTAANKLQRRVVIEQFSTEFEEVRRKGIF